MGLRPLDLSQWFERDGEWDQHLHAKSDALARFPDQVVATLPECFDAAVELHDAVVKATDETSESNEHPLVAASRLVPDDLCIMEKRQNEWRLTGAVVCSPSRWSLASKIGKSLLEIHRPVPGYDSELARPTEQFFHRITIEKPVWRLNWTLLDNPDLFQPESVRRPVVGDPSSWWFRVERQTLVRLEKTAAVVFTIRTYVTSLPDLVSSHPDMRHALLLALDTAPPATLAYKGWTGVADALRPWLND